MAFQDGNQTFSVPDVPASTARLLKSIIQPLPTNPVEAGPGLKSLRTEQTTAIVRALFIASLDQFFDRARWVGLNDESAKSEREMCEATQGVIQYALSGEIARTPTVLVQRFPEQKTLEGLLKRAQGLSAQSNKISKNTNGAELEEELSIWLIIRLIYSAALIRDASTEGLSLDRSKVRSESIHRIEAGAKSIHSYLFCSADREMRDNRSERVSDLAKLWLTLEEEIRAMLLGWGEGADHEAIKWQPACVQLLGVDRRTQLSLSDSRKNMLELDRRPFSIPIFSKSFAVNLLLTSLRIHFRILHHSPQFVDTLSSAVEALVTLWEDTMKLYPTRHNHQALDELLVLLGWFFDERCEPADILFQCEPTEEINYLPHYMKSTSPLSLDKICATVIDQAKLFTCISTSYEHELNRPNWQDIILLLLKILRWLADQDGRTTMTKTARSITHLITRFGKSMVEYIVSSYETDIQNINGVTRILCLLFLCCPIDAQTGRIRYRCDLERTYPNYRLLESALISQLEAYIAVFSPKVLEQVAKNQSFAKLGRIVHWLNDVLQSTCLQLSVLDKRHARKRKHLEIEASQPSLLVNHSTPKQLNDAFSDERDNPEVHKSKTSSIISAHTNISSLLKSSALVSVSSSELTQDSINASVLNSLEQIRPLLSVHESGDAELISTQMHTVERELDLLSSVVCTSSTRFHNFLSMSSSHKLMYLPQDDLKSLFFCFQCDQSISLATNHQRQQLRVFPQFVIEKVVMLFYNSELLGPLPHSGSGPDVKSKQYHNIKCRARLALIRFITRLLNHTIIKDSTGGQDKLNSCSMQVSMKVLGILKQCSRIERIAVGRMVASLFSNSLQLLSSRLIGQSSSSQLEPILIQLESLSKDGPMRIQETLAITLVLCFEVTRIQDNVLIDDGRVDLSNCLSYRICAILLRQMCRRSSYLLGVIRTEMLSLSKRVGTSPYTLLARYLPLLSQVMVVELNFETHGSAFFADLLGMSTDLFLSQTARYTVPLLVLNSRAAMIEVIARAREESIPQLLVYQAADIITQLCLQKTAQDLDKGLRNFYKLLNVGRDDTISETQLTIEISALLQVSAGLIYFRLIAEVIDESDRSRRCRSVKEALWKALQLKMSSPDWNQAPNDDELQQELRSHTLPILSHINASLQDLRGKISMTEKNKVMHGLGDLICLVGSVVSSYIPQIMTTLQASLAIPALRTSTLQTWDLFVKVTPLKDLKPFVGQITAALVGFWAQMTSDQIGLSIIILHRIITQSPQLGNYAFDIADLSNVSIPAAFLKNLSSAQPMLIEISQKQTDLKKDLSLIQKIESLIGRIESESEVVIRQSLKELIALLDSDPDKIKTLITGDTFHPLIGNVVKALIGVTARCNDASDDLKSLAFECLGTVGAVDPDRCDIRDERTDMVVASNFSDHEESVAFALRLLQDELVGAYRSTNDSKHHNFLTYAIQELLRFCGFTPDLINPGLSNNVSNSVIKKWNSMPKHILDSISPLLGSKFKFSFTNNKTYSVPIYKHTTVYGSWLQNWLLRLIPLVQNENAMKVFRPFLGVIRNGDNVISQKLLPYIALHIVISGSDEEAENIKSEIITVLEDQVEPQSGFSPEGRQLAAQTIFGLMDHFSCWLRDRHKAQASIAEAGGFKRKDASTSSDVAATRVQSIIAEISQELIASAALYCKDHARALLNCEQQVLQLKGVNEATVQSLAGETDRKLPPQDDLIKYYEKAHEIYAAIDEPDGMEGISAKITVPSILHQIREHESTGRWTSAQSCWEVELQRQPDELRSHLGLLRCLRNLGHYDSLKAHIMGVLQSHPNWEPELAPFCVESSLVSNDWKGLTRAVSVGSPESPEVIFGKVVDTLLTSDERAFNVALKDARIRLGNQILGTSRKDAYRRMYDSSLYLHILHEVPLIDQACQEFLLSGRQQSDSTTWLSGRNLLSRLDSRLESISPAFRHREQVLRLRRATFQLRFRGMPAVGQLWVQTAKSARKAGHLQTSYSAVLQASELKAPTAFMQKAKLMKLEDQPYKAIVELDDNLEKHLVVADRNVKNLTEISRSDYTKGALLRVRWMDEVGRYSVNCIVNHFEGLCHENPDWASPYYYFGRFYDEKASQAALSVRGPSGKIRVTVAEYNYHCCKNFQKALTYGTKFIYQALPRMLTMYFTLGEHPDLLEIFKNIEKKRRGKEIRQEDYTQALQADELGGVFLKVDRVIHSAVRKLPVFEWLTVLPQVVSRVMHKSTHVQAVVHKILTHVLRSYPDQSLWAMVSGVESSNPSRSNRCVWVLNDAKDFSNPSKPGEAKTLAKKIEQCRKLVRQLLKLCNFPIKNPTKHLRLNEVFPTLQQCTPCDLIIPLQYSLVASLPPHDVNFATHQPFSSDLPCISSFADKITIMASLQKPRKIGIHGTDGKEYPFLCKPKDDLRKDARLMEFNSMINKLLKKDSESRKRNLHIRTYAVVVLNEECGLLEWVPNTIPFRNILLGLYSSKGIQLWNAELKSLSDKLRKHRDDWDKVKLIFERDVLTKFPPVFHQWFLNSFPDPTSWLRSRQAYGRTCAVMSMVGFVLGLGDRHGENILFDATTGDTVHVDFNCLFDKGRTFEVSENVPFRLTHNMIAGLGITGVEGVFRKASEVTMKILRNNKDSLMSVLETFVHDPLVDWMPSGSKRKGVDAPTEEYIAREAKRALEPISRKLTGYQITSSLSGKTDRQMSTENQVDSLINEARDNRHLGRMYFGWAPYL
ncbi:hypothetical protein O181_013511 [Austropuccinia psidii MF-1]|uniref:non-specific serine/threonine protein kinase n=1 Tax=Austropuccinia psidii MF-1 TaxID=1389203 RepID=A0A9Q3BZV7_9BASI|nr:hypothetical protein [Austropuccinia psidii MF-1]